MQCFLGELSQKSIYKIRKEREQAIVAKINGNDFNISHKEHIML
jgi:hypothetical protein